MASVLLAYCTEACKVHTGSYPELEGLKMSCESEPQKSNIQSTSLHRDRAQKKNEEQASTHCAMETYSQPCVPAYCNGMAENPLQSGFFRIKKTARICCCLHFRGSRATVNRHQIFAATNCYRVRPGFARE